jgi:hypothetical protein
MLFLLVMIIFLIWAIYVIRKGRVNWHAVLSIYFVTLFVADYGDVPCDHWFNFYDLPVHLLIRLDEGQYLGIVFSDGLTFPLMAIVFCYYITKYRHKWLLSFISAIILGILELIFVNLGFMIYHHWHHWTTAVISFFAFRVLAIYSERFITYNPPVFYPFRLLCAVYVITEWPGAILGGVMRLFQFKISIFNSETANDRIVAMTLATVMGAIIALLVTKTPQKYRIFLFLGMGICSAVFALRMHAAGFFQYNHWNNFFTVIRYIAPYVIVFLYDKWESDFTKKYA